MDTQQQAKPIRRRRGLISRLNPFSRASILNDPYAYETEDDKLAKEFEVDADAAMIAQDPLRARNVIYGVLLALILLLTWAAFAEVDEITRGEGKAVSAGKLQVVQSLDGGKVSQILVKEGDQVKTGQVLFKIDSTRFQSDLNESRATYLSLLAKAARLQAIADGKPFEAPPEVLAANPMLVDQERALYSSRQAELNTQVSIARDQLSQRTHELREAQAQYQQAKDGHSLSARELEMTRPLIRSGAVSDVEMLRLERDVTRLRGDMNQMASKITRLRSAISEARGKINEVELDFRNQARNELSETQSRINSLSEGAIALSDKVTQAAIKAPVNGTVQRLLHNTVGGVVQPGKDIIEIVPLMTVLFWKPRCCPGILPFCIPVRRQMSNLPPMILRFTAVWKVKWKISVRIPFATIKGIRFISSGCVP